MSFEITFRGPSTGKVTVSTTNLIEIRLPKTASALYLAGDTTTERIIYNHIDHRSCTRHKMLQEDNKNTDILY